jgi:cytochrome c oxidase cbb3-type subunit 4
MSAYQFWQQIAGVGGTLYFAAIFLIVLVYALWPSKKEEFEQAARNPLLED